MNNYYYSEGELVQGPVSLEDLQTYLQEGIITDATPCCIEGAQDWHPYTTLMDNLYQLERSALIPKAPIKEYKVLSQKDKWLSAKFDPETLTKALNAYAEQGWRVVSSSTATFPGVLSANREEIIIIMERDR